MTTPYERTLSVIETGSFLAMLWRDRSLPDNVRDQAKQLLRHYPTPQAVRLAGRCEAIRQYEISKLPISPQTMHPALATWPLLEPFFYDSTERDTPKPVAPPAAATVPKLQSISGTVGAHQAVSLQMLGQAQSTGIGCLSAEYRCFKSARAPS
ncbi:BPSL0761 family protein [Pseudomonas extremaustralis]|uniref:BPSL0761 family protein n=1 Tax=Pseudomonas extremaustralis TaxID=359110 RepID=UPI002FDFF1A0